MDGSTRAHVFVSGQVQGVGFRAEAVRRARERGVAGWVRNLADGRVEAVFEGLPSAVQAMVDWVRKGPRGAVVESVDVRWEEPVGEQSFRIR